MATKLKNMKLTSVDLVRAGANQEADICLYKSAEPQEDPVETPDAPTEKEKSLIKRFMDWLKENPQEDEKEPQIEKEEPQQADEDEAQTFDEEVSERTPNETLDLYLDALEDSIESIQLDDDLDEARKNEVMIESFQEFTKAMEELIPELCKTQPECRRFEDLHKEIEKSAAPEIDTIEETN